MTWFHRPFVALGRAYVRMRARQDLSGVWVSWSRGAREALAGPVVFAPNHTSWWDGLLVVLLSSTRETRIMMSSSRIHEFDFFQSFGAMPIELGDAWQAGLGLRQARRMLAEGKDVWIFPQGEQVAQDTPVVARPGLRALAPTVLPVAFRFAWEDGERPTARIRVGDPVPAGEWEEGLAQALEHARQHEAHASAYELLIPGKVASPAPSRWLSRIWRWVHAWRTPWTQSS